MTEFQLDGKFQQISIDPTAHVELGQDVTLRSFVCLEVGNGATLKLGNRVFFNINCSIHCGYHIEIGKDTMFGDGVRIFDSNHQYSNYHVEKIAFNYGKISIGKNCWIGANVVILKGVTIGDNVIIGAGAVIHKDIPSNSIVVSKEELIIKERPQLEHHVFTLTASDTLENLTYLVENLPEVSFHIAAKTNVSDRLEAFKKYDNVTLYTNVHHDDIIEDLLDQSEIYLDINHWDQVDHIVDRAFEKGKPVFAFDNVAHRADLGGSVFSYQKPEMMVEEIKSYLATLAD